MVFDGGDAWCACMCVRGGRATGGAQPYINSAWTYLFGVYAPDMAE